MRPVARLYEGRIVFFFTFLKMFVMLSLSVLTPGKLKYHPFLTYQLARYGHTQRQHHKHISSPECITPEIKKILKMPEKL
jgi:hypothetical protein